MPKRITDFYPDEINRVLIAGFGSAGMRHLRLVRNLLPHADVRVLCHRKLKEDLELANGVFDNLTDACGFEPNVSIVANPAPFHVQTAGSLITSGSHVLIEKPISNSVEDVNALLLSSKEHKRVLLVGYNLRFLDSLIKFKDLIHSNFIGNVLSIRSEAGQYLPDWRPKADYRIGVSARKALGGGVLLELSHEFDYLRWIFGEVNWASAFTGKQSNLDVDVEDSAHITLGFQSAVPGRQLIASVNLDFIRHDKTRNCTAIGEKGTLRWNGLTGDIEMWAEQKTHWEKMHSRIQDPDDSYRLQLVHFLECIGRNLQPRVSGEDGLAALRIISAINRSNCNEGIRVFVDF
jgi:predicted dehydrogenase